MDICTGLEDLLTEHFLVRTTEVHPSELAVVALRLLAGEGAEAVVVLALAALTVLKAYLADLALEVDGAADGVGLDGGREEDGVLGTQVVVDGLAALAHGEHAGDFHTGAGLVLHGDLVATREADADVEIGNAAIAAGKGNTQSEGDKRIALVALFDFGGILNDSAHCYFTLNHNSTGIEIKLY